MDKKKLLEAIANSRDDAYIIKQAEQLGCLNNSSNERCSELLSAMPDVAPSVVEEVACNVLLGAVKAVPDIGLVVGIAAFAELLKNAGIDDHPLKYRPGQPTEDPVLHDFLVGIGENISVWRESQVQFVSRIALGNCIWCARASACIIAPWCWETEIIPDWLLDWMGKYKIWHRTEAEIFREHLRIKFEI